jgi:aminopeptidase N
VAFDNDSVSRYESIQKVYFSLIDEWIDLSKSQKSLPHSLPKNVEEAFLKLLQDKFIDPAFLAYLFEIPSESSIHQLRKTVDIEETTECRRHLNFLLGLSFFDYWKSLYFMHQDSRKGDLSFNAIASRALKNCALSMMVFSKSQQGLELLEKHFYEAQTMTEEAHGLFLYCFLQNTDSPKAINHFYTKWKHEPLAMLRWYAFQAQFAKTIEQIESMVQVDCFRPLVPNDLRALYQSFVRQNYGLFHQSDGIGYEFVVSKIQMIDQFNPQVASRLTTGFSLLPKLNGLRKTLMEQALKKLIKDDCSRDVFEVASRYLGQA